MADVDIIDTLKARARILHRKLKDQDGEAVTTLRRLPDLRKLEGDALVAAVQRRHCLKAMAMRHGFDGWPHALEVLAGDASRNYGKVFCPGRCEILTNVWCRSHEEALEAQALSGGVILPYRHQFLIATDPYLRELGLDPEDSALKSIGQDWSQPDDAAALRRACGKIVAHTIAREDAN